MEEQEEGSEIKALLKVWLQVLISLIYSYFLVSKLPKGKFRVFTLLPIFYIFTLLPLSLSTPTTSGLSGFFYTWLANFKLLLFAFDLGPLSHHLPSNSFFGFVLVAAFPIKIIGGGTHRNLRSESQIIGGGTHHDLGSESQIIRGGTHHDLGSESQIIGGGTHDLGSESQIIGDSTHHDLGFESGQHSNKPKNVQLPLGLWTKFMIYVVLVVCGVLCHSNKHVHPNVLLGIYCGVIYMILEVVLGLYNKLLGNLLGVELAKPFNEPYLSTSLQDFWGRRWNLMVSDVLRHTIYFPVRAFWANHVGKGWAQGMGTMAAFVVSGLMHELLFYYITRATPTWEVTCFFLLHGVCLVMEIATKRALGLGEDWALPWAVGGPLTIGFVIGTGFWLFMPQLIRNQVDVKSIEELKAVARLVESVSGWNLTRLVGGFDSS